MRPGPLLLSLLCSCVLLATACGSSDAGAPLPSCRAYRSESGGRTFPDGGDTHSDCVCADPSGAPQTPPRCLSCKFVQYGDGGEEYLCLQLDTSTSRPTPRAGCSSVPGLSLVCLAGALWLWSRRRGRGR